MARAYGFESFFVLLKGASGSGIFQTLPGPPVAQPVNERNMSFPQIVGFLVETNDPIIYTEATQEVFHVEPSGGGDRDWGGGRW